MAGPSGRGRARAREERRKHRRIAAIVYCRPAGADYFAMRLEPVDISLGGMRVQSDQELSGGEVLRLDVFVKGVPPVTCSAEVVWAHRMPPGSPTRFEAGVRFLKLSAEALHAMTLVANAALAHEGEVAPASGEQRTAAGEEGDGGVPASDVQPVGVKPPDGST